MEDKQTLKEVANYAIDGLTNMLGYDHEIEELHNDLFNVDYFIIGTFEAKEWLKKYPGTFNAIETIKEYEQDTFGEVHTDFSDPEKVVNMFVYIVGEEILYDLKSYDQDKKLTDELVKEMILELENTYKEVD